MNRDGLKKILMLVIINFLFFALINCGSSSGGYGMISHKKMKEKPQSQIKKGPPPHAPAHGYRAKVKYWYYPSSSVYFDVERKLYFYFADDDWKVSATLSADLKLKLGSYVILEMDTDKPYLHHKEHKKKYPPGKKKKK